MLLGRLPPLRALGIHFVIVMIATGCPTIRLRELFAVGIQEYFKSTNVNTVRTLHIQNVFHNILYGTTANGGKNARAQGQQESILVASVSNFGIFALKRAGLIACLACLITN